MSKICVICVDTVIEVVAMAKAYVLYHDNAVVEQINENTVDLFWSLVKEFTGAKQAGYDAGDDAGDLRGGVQDV